MPDIFGPIAQYISEARDAALVLIEKSFSGKPTAQEEEQGWQALNRDLQRASRGRISAVALSAAKKEYERTIETANRELPTIGGTAATVAKRITGFPGELVDDAARAVGLGVLDATSKTILFVSGGLIIAGLFLRR